MIKRINRFLYYYWNNPREFITRFFLMNIPVNDELYIKLWYRINVGKKLHLDNPIEYNEKLQWLKLHDHNPIYSTMVDKYLVKEYVSQKIGDKYVIPLLGVWDSPKDIDFDSLPNSFVLKVTHGGGNSGVVVCKDKSNFNREEVVAKLSRSMLADGYSANKEWPYKNVKHRVIAEEYMEDTTYHELRDYKFFCFNGVPKIMFVASGRGFLPEPYFDFYDMDYNHLNIKSAHPVSTKENLPPKPSSWEEMKLVATKLSEGLPHVRIDLYEVNGRVYFGEFTFYHWAGCGNFEPEEWNKKLGDWIVLPENEH